MQRRDWRARESILVEKERVKEGEKRV